MNYPALRPVTTVLYFLFFLLFLQLSSATAASSGIAIIDEQLASHQDKSGVLVLDKGEEALMARAWLADHAQESIEIQYFIWSTDNIGILASEAILRAAERGVKVRVIVDDLLIDAPDESLLALALHPNVEIKIYNPKHSVGTSFFQRVKYVFTDFRGINQRMHDKTFIVDGKVAITGGRNMADEYFDYNQAYNFRDRDVLVMGKVVGDIRQSFNRFWTSQLTKSVETLFKDTGLLQNKDDAKKIDKIYKELHAYARSPENFEPEVRQAINNLAKDFSTLTKYITWSNARFISDMPGKNTETDSLGGGGLSTTALAEVIQEAKKSIVIQSPYLVLSAEAKELFRDARKRGVSITISTNSLASTDNLQAFSGYRSQRDEIVEMGIEVYEYMPYPAIQKTMLERYTAIKEKNPVFALHAKTMVVDGETVYVGTYNLDPRSQNLNTEVGIIVKDRKLGYLVVGMIRQDTLKGNSWTVKDNPDQRASSLKRFKVLLWQLLPLEPIL